MKKGLVTQLKIAPLSEVEAFTFQDLVGPWSAFCHFGGLSLLWLLQGSTQRGPKQALMLSNKKQTRVSSLSRTGLSGVGCRVLGYSNGSQLIWFRNAGDGEQIFLNV